MSDDWQRLRALPLFEGVPTTVLQIVAQARHTRRYAPGQTMLTQDQNGDALLLLTSGMARVSRINLGGRERVMGYIYAPAVLGETAVLLSGVRSATVIAVSEVSAQLVYRDEFDMLSQRSPRMLRNLAQMLAERVTLLNDELIAVGVSTEANMLHVFTQLYQQRVASGVAQPQVLPLTPTELTLRLSSSRETVMRILRRLVTAGLVVTGPHSLTLRDPSKLEALLYDFHEEREDMAALDAESQALL